MNLIKQFKFTKDIIICLTLNFLYIFLPPFLHWKKKKNFYSTYALNALLDGSSLAYCIIVFARYDHTKWKIPFHFANLSFSRSTWATWEKRPAPFYFHTLFVFNGREIICIIVVWKATKWNRFLIVKLLFILFYFWYSFVKEDSFLWFQVSSS